MHKKLIEIAEASTTNIEYGDFPFYWECDDYKFDNKNLSRWYEKESGKWASFVCPHLSRLKSNLANTSIDMNADYNAEFLKKLRSKYENIVLWFSGGYDSVTILQTAIDNNIQIDEVLSMIVGSSIDHECNREIKHCAIPYIEQCGYQDKFHLLDNDWEFLTEKYADPYSIFIGSTDSTFPLSFGPLQRITIRHGIKYDACYIKGADKPSLLYYKGRWYQYCLDQVINGEINFPGMLYFWYHPDNIKSLIRDGLLYRDWILENDPPTKARFYKPTQGKEINQVIGRYPMLNHDKLLIKKGFGGASVGTKIRQRFKDCIDNNQYQLLANYFTAQKNFQNLLGIKSLTDVDQLNSYGKFAWFIDIDSYEVFTQDELIPNGFEGDIGRRFANKMLK